MRSRERVLLCTNHLERWAGSEVIIFEIAEALVNLGFKVDIFTNVYDTTTVSPLTESGVNIYDNPRDIRISDYKFVYCHHQLISLLLLPELDALCRNSKTPVFIYNHLSPFDPYEAPGPFLEREIAALVLCNSIETRRRLTEFDPWYMGAVLFQNPAPESFVHQSSTTNPELESILVVSNHMPKEVRDALSLLERRGVRVTRIGRADEHRRLTPADIHNHDSVVTIGKSVQYSIAGNKPVFCYDHFGGPGWLNQENFDAAAERNFSGRCSAKTLPTQTLAARLLSGYADAARFVKTMDPERLRRFLLGPRLDYILDRVEAIHGDAVYQRRMNQTFRAEIFQRQALHEAMIYGNIRRERRARVQVVRKTRKKHSIFSLPFLGR